jgi:cell division protein FtsL
MTATTRAATPSAPAHLGTQGKVIGLLALVAFFTVAALAHVWVRLQVVRLGYAISRETEQEKELQQLHRKLEVERAMLRNPERLERLAREKLSLTMPDPGQIQPLVPAKSTSRPRADRRR